MQEALGLIPGRGTTDVCTLIQFVISCCSLFLICIFNCCMDSFLLFTNAYSCFCFVLFFLFVLGGFFLLFLIYLFILFYFIFK